MLLKNKDRGNEYEEENKIKETKQSAFYGKNRFDYQKKTASKLKVQCNHCNKLGHLENRCWTKYPELRSPSSSLVRQSANTILSKDSIFSFTALQKADETFLAAQVIRQNIWIIDSGATTHMCHIRELFTV